VLSISAGHLSSRIYPGPEEPPGQVFALPHPGVQSDLYSVVITVEVLVIRRRFGTDTNVSNQPPMHMMSLPHEIVQGSALADAAIPPRRKTKGRRGGTP
jgi:hypothetical protein